MKDDGVHPKMIRLLRAYYEQTRARVRAYGELSEFLDIRTGVRQGCALSPTLFNFAIDWILNTTLRDARGVEISPDYNITDLDYADDIAVMASSRDELQTAVESIAETAERIGMKVNVGKTKTVTSGVSNDPNERLIRLNGEEIEEVGHFKYLGAMMSANGQSKEEIASRIAAARRAFMQFNKPLWRRCVKSPSTRRSECTRQQSGRYSCMDVKPYV